MSETGITTLIIVIIVLILLRSAIIKALPVKPFYCKSCGSTVLPKTKYKGSLFIEIILWICFIVPGIIYSIWRITTKRKICSKCKSENIIPLNTPEAEKAIAQNYKIPTYGNSSLKKCPFCAEDIKKDAIKCKHCGSSLEIITE
jgi:DNA-directed RNA polymerase subunit RPC12/RpoP